MEVVKKPRAELERIAHELYRKRFPRGAPHPEFVNAENYLDLDADRTFAFQGRRYVVPPISPRNGVRLQFHLSKKVRPWHGKALTDEVVETYLSVCRETADLIWSMARPYGWRRLLKPFMRNPFHDGQDNELGEIVDFCWRCRTTSSVRLPETPARTG